MKILLFGEYSGFYNTLKDGLIKNGHEVLLTGRSDVFKNYNLDISLEPKYFKNFIANAFRQLIHKFLKFDIADFEIYLRFKKNKQLFKNYDVVQLINEAPFQIHYSLELKLLKYIFNNNDNVFLSACGDDTSYITYLLKEHKKYSILSPYLKDKTLIKHYLHSLSYIKPEKKKIHTLVYKYIKKVTPTSFDYTPAFRTNPRATVFIPLPVKINKLKYQKPNIKNKIIIFHGINTVNYYKKGNFIFNEALEIIKKKHSEKVEIITVESLPYIEYIKSYNKAHILLDQVYAYDQGCNALEAMAKGKVVFTGAEEDWVNHYKVEADTIAINAMPDPEKIAKKLEWLILNPDKIIEISKNARAFVEKEHDYLKIAKKYTDMWQESV